MNVLQEIGIQSWRLRGRQLAEFVNGTGAQIPDQIGTNEVEQELDPPSLLAASDGHRLVERSSRVADSGDVLSEISSDLSSTDQAMHAPRADSDQVSTQGGADRSGALSTDADSAEGALTRAIASPAQQSSKSKDNSDDKQSITMPTLRPAPVPLEASAEIDLTFDVDVPATPNNTTEAARSSELIHPNSPQQGSPQQGSGFVPDYTDADIPAPDDDDGYYDLDIDLPPAKKDASDPALDALSDMDWRNLQARISNQNACPSCGQGKSILGFGDVLANWVFVSDAPTSAEVEANQLFTGRAGQLYEAILHACGLSRDSVYTTTVFKCSPPDDMSLSPQCNKIVHRQIELIQPKVIVTLGELSAQSVLRANESFDVLRSADRVYHGTRCRVIAGHSLQQILSDPELKGELWRRLKGVMSHAG